MRVIAAVMLLGLVSGQANAQQETCYEIARNTVSGPSGALLVNKCTGDAWILLVGGSTFRWYTIPKAPPGEPIPRLGGGG
jgi:hypothetical protein